jgi:pimeloyl-ACP methyl ester carboxylesterase
VLNGLPRITAPALVIVGSDDAPFLAAADYMTAKIPHARKVVIPGAGHAPNVDKPELFDAELRAFLDQVTGSEGRS